MDEPYDPQLHVRQLLAEILHRLQWAADLLRGPEIAPSHEMMRLEMAVTRAMETLSAVKKP